MSEKNYHKDNKSFMVYKDWEEYIGMLSDEQAGKLFRALFGFASRGEMAELEPQTNMAFLFMKSSIERDGKKWEETCRRNSENAKKRWEENQKKDSMRSYADTEKETETVTDTYTDNDTQTYRDSDKAVTPSSYGKFCNVALTVSEYNSLLNKCGQQRLDHYIEKLSCWLYDNEKKCKSAYRVIDSWIIEDGNISPLYDRLNDTEGFRKFLENYSEEGC